MVPTYTIKNLTPGPDFGRYFVAYTQRHTAVAWGDRRDAREWLKQSTAAQHMRNVAALVGPSTLAIEQWAV